MGVCPKTAPRRTTSRAFVSASSDVDLAAPNEALKPYNGDDKRDELRGLYGATTKRSVVSCGYRAEIDAGTQNKNPAIACAVRV